MAANTEDTLRILCIHGYRQNSQTFRERTGAFRKIIKKHAELVFITAPNIVPPLETKDGEESGSVTEEQRGWWFSRGNDYFRAQDLSDSCKGYEESLDVIRKAFDDGPFDGVLGFSQGASMLSLLCGIKEQDPESPFQFDFAILIAGFKSKSSPHNELYSQTIRMPTLHVFGDTDKVIPKDLSEELLPHFEQPSILQHPGGHFIPASGPQKKLYLAFLDEMKKRKKAKN